MQIELIEQRGEGFFACAHVLCVCALDSNLIATSELELFLLSHFADQTVWIETNAVKVSLESKREQHLAIPFGWGCDVDMADLCQRSRF